MPGLEEYRPDAGKWEVYIGIMVHMDIVGQSVHVLYCSMGFSIILLDGVQDQQQLSKAEDHAAE